MFFSSCSLSFSLWLSLLLLCLSLSLSLSYLTALPATGLAHPTLESAAPATKPFPVLASNATRASILFLTHSSSLVFCQ